ncbi:MAG: hypothetical protein EZS28_018790 [Streblomastix strix]|uniref:Uncharacterized protein n=1 Tax=Streblomastix strix TaxID=222440 RepID=A0A5J4VTQ5_9EUKA|nr:MAG: hypothetical protein EZS28_018790 [Streblomastix strix]
MPSKPTKCDDDETEIVKHLVGFKYGYLTGLSNDDMKKYITRVGSVIGYIYRYNGKEEVGRSARLVFYRWEKNEAGNESWIYAFEDQYDTGSFNTYKYTEAKAPFLITGYTSSEFGGYYVLYFDCKNPLATTPETICECPTDPTALANDPRKGTICEEQVDLVPETQICTAKDTPSKECKCLAVKEGDYTKEKCEEDKASTEKEAAGSIRVSVPSSLWS